MSKLHVVLRGLIRGLRSVLGPPRSTVLNRIEQTRDEHEAYYAFSTPEWVSYKHMLTSSCFLHQLRVEQVIDASYAWLQAAYQPEQIHVLHVPTMAYANAVHIDPGVAVQYVVHVESFFGLGPDGALDALHHSRLVIQLNPITHAELHSYMDHVGPLAGWFGVSFQTALEPVRYRAGFGQSMRAITADTVSALRDDSERARFLARQEASA